MVAKLVLMVGGSAWDEITMAARRLDEQYAESEFSITPLRRRGLNRWVVREGLHVGNLWTDVFEDVRVRRLFSKRWTEIQTLAEAERCVHDFIRSRPDLR